jgi:NTE family protein
VDLTTALEMGASEIFAIDLTPPPVTTRPKTAVGVLKQSFSILSSASTRAVEDCLGLQMPVRVVRPDLLRSSPSRLDDSAGAIAHNLRLARESLAGAFDGDGRVAPTGTCWQGAGAQHGELPEAVEPARFFHRRRAG